MYWINHHNIEKINKLIVEGPDYSLVGLDGWSKIIPNSELYRFDRWSKARRIQKEMLRDRYGIVGDLVAAHHRYNKHQIEKVFIVEKRTDRCLYGSDENGEFKFSVDHCVVIQKAESMDEN